MTTPSTDPAAALDVSRAPRGELVAGQLVAAAAAIGDLAERHYLELKGPSDLASKVSKAKIAKFILGAANRQPDRAAEAFEGYGVMIVGITASGAEGVPPVEMLALSEVIQPFLGATGPRWDVVRVPVQDSANQMIVVLVDPPQMGQPPFICRENGEGLQSGRIYVRADGATREANAGELDLLLARGAAEPSAPVELGVAVVGKVTPIIVDNERTLEEYIKTVSKRLLDAMPPPAPPPELKSSVATEDESGDPKANADARGLTAPVYRMAASMGAYRPNFASFLGSEEPEQRTQEQYRSEIDRWERRFRDVWSQAVELFASMVLDPNEVAVTNKTQTFLHDVEVNLHLEGAVDTLEHEYSPDDGPDWSDLTLPSHPRKWGPTRKDPAFGLGYQPNFATPGLQSYLPSGTFAPPSTSWKNGGSVDVNVGVGDLRPEATFKSDDRDAILVINGEIPTSIHGSWKATARGYNEVFTGDLEVEVAEPTILTELLREFLDLK